MILFFVIKKDSYMENSIYQFLVKYHGNWDKVYDAINEREKVSTDYSFRTSEKSIFIISDEYHDKFKKILMPPFYTFYKGDIQFLDKNVIGIVGKISNNELDKIIKSNSESVICFNNNDFTNNNYDLLISKEVKFIVICEGSINTFEYEWNKNILLISEYDNVEDYQPSLEQTVERLLYSISDSIIAGYIEICSWEKLAINLKDDPKTIQVSDHQLKWLSEVSRNFNSYSNHIKLLSNMFN